MSRASSLKARVDIRPRVILRPTRGLGGSRFYNITVNGTNTIYSNGSFSLLGLDFDPAVTITTVPSATPGSYGGAIATGLAKGTLATTNAIVWVAARADPGTGVISDLQSDVPAGNVVLSRFIVNLPLATDSSVLVPVYIPWLF